MVSRCSGSIGTVIRAEEWEPRAPISSTKLRLRSSGNGKKLGTVIRAEEWEPRAPISFTKLHLRSSGNDKKSCKEGEI
jgi:hypothetical protein